MDEFPLHLGHPRARSLPAPLGIKAHGGLTQAPIGGADQVVEGHGGALGEGMGLVAGQVELGHRDCAFGVGHPTASCWSHGKNQGREHRNVGRNNRYRFQRNPGLFPATIPPKAPPPLGWPHNPAGAHPTSVALGAPPLWSAFAYRRGQRTAAADAMTAEANSSLGFRPPQESKRPKPFAGYRLIQSGEGFL